MDDAPVLDDKGGEGVAERKEEAPEESTGEGRLGYPEGKDPMWGYGPSDPWGLQESFINNIAAEHSVIVSSSSMRVSEVRRFRDL